MTGAAEAPATTETPAASTATAEPALPTTAEAMVPPPTPVAESEPAAETALLAPAIPLPRLKPPPPAAAAPSLAATAESTAAAATAEATPPTAATASPGASLGSAATASAVTAPAATETTQTASAAAPAASNGGEPPWKRNSRPFPVDDPRPRVSLVISGLGLTATQTQAAIDQLPPEITLGFSPYSGDLEDWIAKARAAGHEVLIELPMEPLNYPADDPGPQALLASLSPAENLKRLDWVLARSNQMIGLVANMGSRFQANARLIRPILTRLAEKGYLYVDNRSGPTSVISEVAASVDLPWTYNTRFIDAEATRVSIDGRLQQLERTAREKGFALGLAQGYPVTIERVAAWAKSLEVKGLALAPASALAKTGAQ
ncbi:divergent polysaccharide deacetylase family protein [Hypericibacter terrae]|uniref:divergent polysaccharide deacetylase family protein n=1 Tax=Hypericibacter terrae TaxID=2602015 RepID=UPI00124579BC|nr:divergent polysaccharide deacetylase family protein [Hypericibacter terrae]